jgi:creatinine amidohydrolase
VTRAQMIGDMTSSVVDNLLSDGQVDVLIPLGSLEQHGGHLPLATDLIIAEAMAAAVGTRYSDSMLVAPCMPIGFSDYHLGFAGTASVPLDVVRDYLRSAIMSFLEGGFRHVYVVSGHAGNLAAMESARRSLPAAFRARTVVHGDWPAQRKAIHQWAEEHLGLGPEKVGSHGGHFETSVMLHLAPELVNMSAASAGFIGDAATASEAMMTAGMRAVSPAGVIGDPRSASASAGVGYLQVVVDLVTDLIARHRSGLRTS